MTNKTEIEIIIPDDFHHHFRDDDILDDTVHHAMNRFSRAMPTGEEHGSGKRRSQDSLMVPSPHSSRSNMVHPEPYSLLRMMT